LTFSHSHDLRGGHFDVASACGSMVPSDFNVFRFCARRAQKRKPGTLWVR